MEKFEVTILGCGSAVPTGKHMTTSQLVSMLTGKGTRGIGMI